MSGMTTANSSLLTRSELWSSELKETLKDDLMGMNWVDIINDFPDGDQFNIPSIGDAHVDNYAEDDTVKYRPLDTGEWTFSIDEYLSSGTYITRKNEQDMYYMSQLVSGFVPKQRRAIMEHYETTLLEKPEDILGATANDTFSINDARHRFAGGNSGKLEVADFAYAQFALKKANVPQENLVAIVDPSVEFEMNTLTNITDVSNNPRWEGIVAEGIGTGMRFVKNIYGFDIYTSNRLPTVTDNALVDRSGSNAVDFTTSATVIGKPCYFFSAASDVLPWKSAWRQMPTVDMEWNKDKQRTEFVTTARYGSKLYRPENMVSIIHNTVV